MKQVVHTPAAPAPVGPYSQAIIANGLIFTAGQTGVNPSTGKLVDGVQEQTRQTLENIRAILEAAGSGLDKVVKTTVFLQNMSEFAAMNEVYASFSPSSRPRAARLRSPNCPSARWSKSKPSPKRNDEKRF